LETLFVKNRQIIAPLERVLERYQSPDGEEGFAIPIDTDTPDSANKMADYVGGFLVQISAEVLPAHSWPSLLARETGLVAGSKGQYTGQVLDSIYQSPQSGPLALWATASLLHRFHLPTFRLFASRSLLRLSAADFQNDYRVLLVSNSVLTQCLVNLADTLRDLDDAQIEPLASILPPPERDLLRRCVRDLRAAQGQPLLSTLSPALDAYWDQSLKQRIRTALIALTLDFK
jgi:hypothetical protein